MNIKLKLKAALITVAMMLLVIGFAEFATINPKLVMAFMLCILIILITWMIYKVVLMIIDN